MCGAQNSMSIIALFISQLHPTYSTANWSPRFNNIFGIMVCLFAFKCFPFVSTPERPAMWICSQLKFIISLRYTTQMVTTNIIPFEDILFIGENSPLRRRDDFAVTTASNSIITPCLRRKRQERFIRQHRNAFPLYFQFSWRNYMFTSRYY